VSLSTHVLIALGAGVAAGIALSQTDPGVSRAVVAAVEPFGTLFVNAIRMTVVPLVVSSLVVGVASTQDRAMLARVGGRGLLVFVVLLSLSGTLAAIVTPPIVARLQLDPAAVAQVRAASPSDGAVAAGAASIQGPAAWFVSLVPSNAISAAVDGAMLPLIVFALALGLALGRIDAHARDEVVTVFRAIAESMLTLVRWLLVVAPLGVFALSLPLVARLGLAAVGALAVYVVIVSVAAVALIVFVLTPAATLAGRIPLRRFVRAALPAQAVAFSSRSSLAALPALIDSARTRLGMSDEITGFFLPFATAMFRVAAPFSLTAGAVFLSKLYGVAMTPAQLGTVVATSVLTSFSVPGIPGGSILVMVPVLSSVGLPLEGLGILLGVDTIPDIFRTTANVTGQLTAATIVARGAEPAPEAALAS
jgi:proton glutamate symport protein